MASSLRKKFSSYLRQLSFHNDTKEKRHNINENTFVTKYLEGQIFVKEGPPIIHGKNPTDLPNYDIGEYENGPNSVIGCYSGPNGGLTTVKRTEKHLSILDGDIDFIDTYEEDAVKPTERKVISGKPIDNTTMIIKVAGHEYCVTNKPKRHSKSLSLGSISDLGIEIETTKIEKTFYVNQNNNEQMECKNKIPPSQIESNCDKENVNTGNVVSKVVEFDRKERKLSNITKNEKDISRESQQRKTTNKSINKRKNSQQNTDNQNSFNKLSKSKSDGNPFQHRKKGKIVKVNRPITTGSDQTENSTVPFVDDSRLPNEWNRKCDYFYGLSDSLYDRNQVTRIKNGDPIADCFGIISRKDSAILAVADGVNWGEKASIAAKSAIHGSLHYLNKTIFNDSKPFENLTVKTDASSVCSTNLIENNKNLIGNTREVFICLLRAFNCAHDLILENEGMLTTLTVAVVLPLKQKLERKFRSASGEEKRSYETQYVCCVCNVGDTLAYVYSQKYGVRELTKGSHDINCNRDMRDALGALGPVDGINPELSNLTISVTTLQKGDIVMVASDGLTDNFDPNICKYTVSTVDSIKPKPANTKLPQKKIGRGQQPIIPENRLPVQKNEAQKPPIKPPRRSKKSPGGSSFDRNSVKSSSVSEKSSSPSIENDRPNGSGDGEKSAHSSNEPKEERSLDNEVEKSGLNIASVDNKESNDKKTENNIELDNPLIAQFMRENSLDDTTKSNPISPKTKKTAEAKASSLKRDLTSRPPKDASRRREQTLEQFKTTSNDLGKNNKSNVSNQSGTGYRFLRSKTTIDMRSNVKSILRNEDGIPYVTPMQRYELQILLMEDILRNGISGKDSPCTSAKKLCENLISYTISITSAKRHTLEDPDLYYDNRNGVLVEVSAQEKRVRRKKGLEKVQNLPGKLDHVTVVAYNVGSFAY